MLVVHTSVKMWSMSFYESVQSNQVASSLIRPSWPEQGQEMNVTFKLVIDMLNRGQGSLAGRVARKAFSLVEETLRLEGPALMWNMLEIMHFIVTSRHLQLFQMLFTHLMALVDIQMPKNHPLPAILRALRVFIPSLPDLIPTSSNSLPNSSSSPPSLDEHEAKIVAESCLLSGAASYVIKQAWTLNAEILFNHFDHRLFQLYMRIHWDSCSIEPPIAIISASKQWLARIKSQQISTITAKASQTEGLIQITPIEEDKVFQRAFATPNNASPPRNYEVLRVASITALREHASSIFSEGVSSAGSTTTLLRILAVFVTAKIIEDWPATTEPSNTEINVTSRVSRGQAENVADAVRTSMSLDPGYNGLGASLDTVARIQSIVDLRAYSHIETDPRIIREMWLLEDALVACGEHRRASEVQQTAYRRLEKYIQDIPVSTLYS